MVPDHQSLMLPILRIIENGKEYKLPEVANELAHHLNLTEKDREERIPSGKEKTFENRIRWAKTYLMKAGLVEGNRGTIKITPEGASVLKSNPIHLNAKFLMRYPSFRDFISRKKLEDHTKKLKDEELLEACYERIISELKDELLKRIKKQSPYFFERLVIDLLVSMGYGQKAANNIAFRSSGDEGIDGVIYEDHLGLNIICVQAKKWETPVGRPVVQAFAGSLEGYNANKGVLLTTSTFTKEARKYIELIEKRIVSLSNY